jgi:molybdopterin-synthase adenylyltransferase
MRTTRSSPPGDPAQGHAVDAPSPAEPVRSLAELPRHDALPMRRPLMKPELAPWRTDRGTIRLGGWVYGIAAEIGDPTGAVWTLITALDGTASQADVVARVLARHPAESPQSVRRCLQALVASGYIEDAAEAVPARLTSDDTARLNRTRSYFALMDQTPRTSSWEPVARLRTATVTIIGVGGTGGPAAAALAETGIGAIHCVDDDDVELSNLSRGGLYTEADVGTPKAAAAAGHLRDLSRTVEVTASRIRVTGVADVRDLARRCDVLLLSADEPPDIHRWVSRACMAENTVWVDAGYAGPAVEVSSFVPGQGACWECLRAAASAEGPPPSRPAPSSAVTAGISGCLAAHHVIARLTGVPPIEPGRSDVINLYAPPFSYSRVATARPGCQSGCGSGR